jgi:gingipain R
MRSFLLVASLIALCSSAGAQVRKQIEQTADGYKLDLTFDNVTVTPAGDNWYKVDVAGSAHILYPDVPQMPYMAYSFLTQGAVELEVTNSTYTDYFGYDVVPSKGNLSRTDDPSKIKPVAGALYQQNAFFPSDIATTAREHMIRSAHGQVIYVYPVQYNPVTHVLRIYHNIEISVKTEQAQKPAEVTHNVLWDNIYRRHFVNYDLLEGSAAKSTYSVPAENGDMLIVTPGQYIANLENFINWKKERGIRCLVMNIDTMSSGPDPDSIKARIKGYYQQYGINYVVLIGDIADMPVIDDNSVAGPSDAAYTYVSGNDHYPDLLIGRFSANNWMELEPQLYKSIEYEKHPTTSQAWYTRAIGVASDEGPGDDNQMDWEHMAGVRQLLLSGTFAHVDEAYDGTHNITDAPLDLPGNPDQYAVINAINTGVSLLNYCGHGSSTSMATTGFGNGHVPQLTNTNGQWPFMRYRRIHEQYLAGRKADAGQRGRYPLRHGGRVHEFYQPIVGSPDAGAG